MKNSTEIISESDIHVYMDEIPLNKQIKTQV